MKYPCGIIKDLLPLYVDEVCNEESRQVVENHLTECEACRKYYEAMKATEGYVDKENSEDINMVNSLKTVKNKLNKRIAVIILCVVAAAVTCVGGYHLLFNAAIKDVPLEDVSVSANVYSVEELLNDTEAEESDADSVTISADEDDDSKPVAVEIPEIGNATIHITMNTLEKYQSLSVVTVKSDYLLRDIQEERINETIYITEIKTTLLNNKAGVFQTNICGLEFGEINQIVFVEEDGTETVLWSR